MMQKNDQSLLAAMRGIALDAINKAGQGHIGMAIGAAPITLALIGKSLNFTKEDPKWINRDRFVMSAGHGSMALYSVMHFMGRLNLDDIKAHKELHSKTPSHPEIDATEFVDASTGPLGQGMALGVGMAIAQEYMARRYNRPGFPVFDHHVFVLHGDGCLQEGVGSEALQLAGTLKLNRLVFIHDYNGMQIDSASREVNDIDFKKWFEAMRFNVIIVPEPSVEAIQAAIAAAKKSDRPTYIQVKTVIAEHTPVANTPGGHNGTLTEAATNQFKAEIGLPPAAPFTYDKSVYEYGAELAAAKEDAYRA